MEGRRTWRQRIEPVVSLIEISEICPAEGGEGKDAINASALGNHPHARPSNVNVGDI